MMQPGMPGGGVDGRPQDFLSVAIPTALAIEIGEVDRRRCKLWAQPKRCSIFGFRLGRKATAGIEVTERRTCFRPIGVEALRGNEFGCGALEALAVGR